MAIAKGLENACLVVERSAKSNAPVRTGNLRSSITHKVSTGSLEGVIGTAIDYAPYVEIGTGIYSSMGGGRQGGWKYVDAEGNGHFTMGSRPQPFMKPAMDTNLSAILKCFEGLI
jgi:HK97 gp10 family phage protein